VNRPDLIDVYELYIHPEDKDKYFIQGKYETIDKWEAKIQVKLWGPFRWTFKRDVMWSIHGPVFKNPYGTYGVRFSGYGEVRHVEQWFQMNKATNYEEFEQAMSMQALPMFNTVYADKVGNISYVYNALMPLRMSDAYNWESIVPGNTNQTLWRGYIEYDILPRVVNPESGFVQNCNSTPYKASMDEDISQMPFLLKNLGIETYQTNRAHRTHETYGADTSITREEFYRYKFDTKYSENSVMAVNLKQFLSEATTNDPNVQEALDLLKDWDLDTDSTGNAMHLAYEAIQPKFNPNEYIYNYKDIMDRLEESVNHYQSIYGRLDIKWGDIQRLKRGDTDLPLSGGPDVLRAIYSRVENGSRLAMAGDCFYQIVEWSPEGEVSSQSIHQYGTATQDETSPHYGDQAKLFAKHQMKPVWMKLEDIKLNLEKSYRPGEE
jgi:penicillin amidase/acyl-homoserine-lactone acylase